MIFFKDYNDSEFDFFMGVRGRVVRTFLVFVATWSGVSSQLYAKNVQGGAKNKQNREKIDFLGFPSFLKIDEDTTIERAIFQIFSFVKEK